MPVCEACGSSALVVWNRRPNDAELSEIPELDSGAMVAVYACGSHAISGELAALIHASRCTGPRGNALPNCDCTPEALPAPEQDPIHELPESWVNG